MVSSSTRSSAGFASSLHLHEPLLGDPRLDHLIRTFGIPYLIGIFLNLHDVALFFQCLGYLFSHHKPVFPDITIVLLRSWSHQD
jgi:hypothetical protein